MTQALNDNILVKSNSDGVKQPVTQGRDKRLDSIFAHIREIRARLIALESQSSTLRRDVNAVRMKVYRDTNNNQVVKEVEVKEQPIDLYDRLFSEVKQ